MKMFTQPNPVQTLVANPVTASEIMQDDAPQRELSDWPRLEFPKPSGYVLNSPIPPSSSGGIEYRIDNTRSEDYFVQRAASILAYLDPRAFSSDLNSLIEFVVHGASSFPVELVNALDDLQNTTDEAIEEGFPVPSGIALKNADRLLREMYRISPRRFEVYPTPDGEIAIDAPGGYGRSVLLLCDSEGGALCLVNMDGNPRRARYFTTERLPDGFVREALAELEYESAQAQ